MMKSKNLCIILVTALVLVLSCAAYADGVKLGMLMPVKLIGNLDESPRDFSDIIVWRLNNPRHDTGRTTPRFYDNLASMLMALNAGDIDEFMVSQPTGEYVTAVNPTLAVSCATRVAGSAFVFGFRAEDGQSLRNKFNSALADMRKDGTLESLKLQYCANPGKDKLDSVKMDHFPDAETVSVVVTGDVPPLDFVAADGEAAGFNTAILAEIGRRLKVNIKLVYAESSARTAALMSGRADVVFWYQSYRNTDNQPDLADGVLFSEPYYDFNIMLHISAK